LSHSILTTDFRKERDTEQSKFLQEKSIMERAERRKQVITDQLNTNEERVSPINAMSIDPNQEMNTLESARFKMISHVLASSDLVDM